MAFVLPTDPNSAVFRERINQEAKKESESTMPLLLSEQGLTGGMFAACVDPVTALLDEFKKKTGDFNAALRPYLDKIAAMQGVDKQIEEKKKQFKMAEDNVEEIYQRDAVYTQTVQKHDRAKAAYEQQQRAQGQRNAKNFPPLLYGIVLLGIGTVEWLINYESFLNFYDIKAMAIGFTLAVAIAVACASHWHGTRLQATDYYFGPHVMLSQKSKEVRAIVIVSLALIIAFAYVGWVRYAYMVELASQFSSPSGLGIGEDAPEINVVQKVSVTLIANVLVWFIGAALAYGVHDKVPSFTEKLREYNAANKEFLKWRAKIEAERKQLCALLNSEIEALTNTAQAYEQQTKPLADMQVSVAEKTKNADDGAERLINGLIRNYRTILGNLAATGNPNLKCNQSGRIIDLETYRQHEIRYSLKPSGASS